MGLSVGDDCDPEALGLLRRADRRRLRTHSWLRGELTAHAASRAMPESFRRLGALTEIARPRQSAGQALACAFGRSQLVRMRAVVAALGIAAISAATCCAPWRGPASVRR